MKELEKHLKLNDSKWWQNKMYLDHYLKEQVHSNQEITTELVIVLKTKI